MEIVLHLPERRFILVRWMEMGFNSSREDGTPHKEQNAKSPQMIVADGKMMEAMHGAQVGRLEQSCSIFQIEFLGILFFIFEIYVVLIEREYKDYCN